jgi:flagellar protein FlaG
MRIESMGAGASYPGQGQTGQSNSVTGKESGQADKVSSDNSTKKNTEIMHQEAEQAAAVRSEQNEHEVIQAIEKANKHIRTYDRRLEFSIHDSTKQIMVKVINTEDDSVIREIPSEKILDMVAHMWEVAGILVDEKR